MAFSASITNISANKSSSSTTRVVIPNENDVLFGRGSISNYPGNKHYRSLVKAQKSTYLSAKNKIEKRAIAESIMQQLNNLHPPGRFLMEDRSGLDHIYSTADDDTKRYSHPLVSNKVWVQVSDDLAIDKVMHGLREKKEEKKKKKTCGNNNEKNVTRTEKVARSNGSNGLAVNGEDVIANYEPIGGENESVGQYDDLFDDIEENNGQCDGLLVEGATDNEVGQFDDLFNDTGLQEFTGEEEEEDIAGQFDGISDDGIVENNSRPVLEEECGSLDGDELSESRLVGHANNMAHEQHLLHEFTLKQWVGRCKSKLWLGYTKATLSIVLKLVDFLIDAGEDEKNGQGNSVALESILAENVLIQSKQPQRRGEDEVIEHVWIMSSVGENSDAGTVMDRLCAVGNVLYELFAGEEYKLTLEDGMQNFDGADVTLECIDVDGEDDNRPRKREPYSENGNSNCLATLESKGVPSSVRALVSNLMGCGQGDHCDDGAYTSFHDLRTDLRLMLDDPSRFLDDIQVNNGLPTLEICDKLYGRESEESKLNQLYQQHINAKELKGVIISGGAGIGKSRLAMHIQKLTSKANGYFYMAKFQQNNMHVKPLSTIGALFNSLCDRFAEDASPLQLRLVSDELASALGSQAGLLAGVVPSLLKLMPCSISLEDTSIACVDAPSSMRYLFGELLRVVSHHSNRHISLLIDDIQFADSASLLLISDLLFSAARSDSSVFFAFCHRDNDPDLDSGTFNIWLNSISMYGLEELKLDNMNVEGVNSLISDSLHLSPRITRPLSAVLHHKTMGNPLFVRQLLASLTGQGYIYIDLSQPRWTWDLKKIAEQEISESVIALLMKEMKRLPSDLQLGLKVASCLGSCVQKNVLEILSRDVSTDLIDILQQVSEKGFMSIGDDGIMFSFAHDKIQQAAYELMSQQEQRKNHMQYGMAIWSYTSDNCPDNNELFFTAITQINHGGPSVISDPNQSTILAELNLKAGKLSIVLSDYATALSLFEHGISYLGNDKWTLEYDISLDLFDLAAEAACILNKNAAVMSYTKELVANAKSFDDSLNCLAVAAKHLYRAGLLEQSIKSSLDTLAKLGEQPLRDMSDDTLKADMMKMNEILRNTSDESILNLHENKAKKINTTLEIYSNLCSVLHFAKPSLVGAVSLRMVELTMSNGLASSSPIAFGYYGEALVANGSVKEGCRLGRLALKLVENKLSLVHKSAVIAIVYDLVLWACDPLQSIIEAHDIGRKVGQQSGDHFSSAANWHMSIKTSYLAGICLDKVQTNAEDYIMTMQSHNSRVFVGGSILVLHQARVLKDGLCALDSKPSNNIPSEKEALQQFSNPLLLTTYTMHQLVRAYLFRRLDDLESLDIVNISDDIERNKNPPRALFVFSIFFEGLASFLLARQSTRDSERSRWIERGEKVLTKMRYWSEHSSWNWEDKMVLLEAEKMYTMGNFDQAALLYERAIRLAHDHKFINDEAIASELAGTFFCERGLNDIKAESLLLHSVQCYKTWGALAVARRVETYIASKFGADCSSLDQRVNVLKGILVVSQDDSSKKRKE